MTFCQALPRFTLQLFLTTTVHVNKLTKEARTGQPMPICDQVQRNLKKSATNELSLQNVCGSKVHRSHTSTGRRCRLTIRRLSTSGKTMPRIQERTSYLDGFCRYCGDMWHSSRHMRFKLFYGTATPTLESILVVANQQIDCANCIDRDSGRRRQKTHQSRDSPQARASSFICIQCDHVRKCA